MVRERTTLRGFDSDYIRLRIGAHSLTFLYLSDFKTRTSIQLELSFCMASWGYAEPHPSTCPSTKQTGVESYPSLSGVSQACSFLSLGNQKDYKTKSKWLKPLETEWKSCDCLICSVLLTSHWNYNILANSSLGYLACSNIHICDGFSKIITAQQDSFMFRSQ